MVYNFNFTFTFYQNVMSRNEAEWFEGLTLIFVLS